MTTEPTTRPLAPESVEHWREQVNNRQVDPDLPWKDSEVIELVARFLDTITAIEREARAALLDELEAAVRGMDATCHDGEGLRCDHVEDWPGVPGAPFDDGCNTDVSRASVLALIQQHREGNP